MLRLRTYRKSWGDGSGGDVYLSRIPPHNLLLLLQKHAKSHGALIPLRTESIGKRVGKEERQRYIKPTAGRGQAVTVLLNQISQEYLGLTLCLSN